MPKLKFDSTASKISKIIDQQVYLLSVKSHGSNRLDEAELKALAILTELYATHLQKLSRTKPVRAPGALMTDEKLMEYATEGDDSDSED